MVILKFDEAWQASVALKKKLSRLVCCHVPIQYVIPYHGFLRASSHKRDGDGHSLGIHSFNWQSEVFPVYHVVVPFHGDIRRVVN